MFIFLKIILNFLGIYGSCLHRTQVVAQQKGRELQQGVDQVKGGVNWLLAESEQVLGDGGMVSGFLDETTDTLINQLSVLNSYIDQGDELLFGDGTSDNDRFQGDLAEGIIGRVNEDVAKTVEGVNEQLDEAQQQVLAAEIHIAKGQLDAAQREDTADESELEAVSEAAAAQERGLMAQVDVYEAKTGANSEVVAAQAQASRLEKDAKGEKLSEGDKPSRIAGTGSGLDKDTVRKGVVLDTSFGDGEIDGLQERVLTSQQQQLLGDGLGEIKVQFNGMPNPLVEAEIEEEEEETTEQYRRWVRPPSWQQTAINQLSRELNLSVNSRQDGFNNVDFRGNFHRSEAYDKNFVVGGKGKEGEWELESTQVHEIVFPKKEWKHFIEVTDDSCAANELQQLTEFLKKEGTEKIKKLEESQIKSIIINNEKEVLEKQLKVSDHLPVVSTISDCQNEIKTGVFNIQTLGHRTPKNTKEAKKYHQAIAETIKSSGADVMTILEVMGTRKTENKPFKKIVESLGNTEIAKKQIINKKPNTLFSGRNPEETENIKNNKQQTPKVNDAIQKSIKDNKKILGNIKDKTSLDKNSDFASKINEMTDNFKKSVENPDHPIAAQYISKLEELAETIELVKNKEKYNKSDGKNTHPGIDELEKIKTQLNQNTSNNPWEIAYPKDPKDSKNPDYIGPGFGGQETIAFLYNTNRVTLDKAAERKKLGGVTRDPVQATFKVKDEWGNETNKKINVLGYHPKSPSDRNKNIDDWKALNNWVNEQNNEQFILSADTNIKGTTVEAFTQREFKIKDILSREQKVEVALQSIDKNVDLNSFWEKLDITENTQEALKNVTVNQKKFKEAFLELNKEDISIEKYQELVETQLSKETQHSSLGTVKGYGKKLTENEPKKKLNNLSFGSNHEQSDDDNRKYNHELTEDGKNTKLSLADPRYQLVQAEGDLVVYKFVADGKETFRIVNKTNGYSIYTKTKPEVINGKLNLSSKTAKLFAHGEPTGDTYDAPDIDQSYYAPEGQNLRSSPAALIDKPTFTNSNSIHENHKLSKPREQFMDEKDGYSLKHLDETMHSTINQLGENEVIVVPSKYEENLDTKTLVNDLSEFGVKGCDLHICRGDDNSETYKFNLSEKARQATPNIIDGIRANIDANTNSSANKLNQKLDSLKNKAQDIGDNIKDQPFRNNSDRNTNNTNPDNNKLDTSGNLQIQVGDGEFTTAFWGNTNIGIKVGDGGFKGAVYGDNNIFVHVGEGDNAKHTQTLGNYTAFEGLQLFMGQRNLSFNYGDSNDLILMHDQSVPLPPFQSPFAGPTDIINYLKTEIAQFSLDGQETDPFSGEPIEDNYYDSQNYLWSLDNIKPIIDQLSSLDQNSSVEYETLYDYGSQSDRNIRALQADVERAANKGFNRMMAGGSPFERSQTTPIKDQNFNITIAGRGADILLDNGDYQFMFGDNLASFVTFSRR